MSKLYTHEDNKSWKGKNKAHSRGQHFFLTNNVKMIFMHLKQHKYFS